MKKHKHILCMRWKDGKFVECCVHHECDYEVKDAPNDDASLREA